MRSAHPTDESPLSTYSSDSGKDINLDRETLAFLLMISTILVAVHYRSIQYQKLAVYDATDYLQNSDIYVTI